MKNKDYTNAKFKHQLLTKKYRGETSVIWTLRPDQVEYIENVLGFEVVPYIFRINTRTFYSKDVLKKNSILKEVHYAGRDRKTQIFRRLNSKEQKILTEYGVRFAPYKYKIFLM